jgi:hypothetical protein
MVADYEKRGCEYYPLYLVTLRIGNLETAITDFIEKGKSNKRMEKNFNFSLYENPKTSSVTLQV